MSYAPPHRGSVSRDPELVGALQERAARACPAEHIDHVGPWWLRHSRSRAWWTATVLAHGSASADELHRRIEVAERFYADRGTATRFQITPGASPDELDALLERSGYQWASPISLRAAEAEHVAGHAPSGALRMRVDDEPGTSWFDVWHAVHGDAGDRRAEWDVLTRVRAPSAYVRAILDDEVVAVGRAVADHGWAGVFGMATLPHARGRHAGRAVLAELAAWARGHGTDHLYLQVERDNAAALRLYDAVGFTEVCEYHYRLGPAP